MVTFTSVPVMSQFKLPTHLTVSSFHQTSINSQIDKQLKHKMCLKLILNLPLAD